jgi:glutathione S-transferase
MKLHTNQATPFGRKVLVLAEEVGLAGKLEVLNEQLTPVTPNAAVIADNPLGKIPCLVIDDGTALYDSRVICEYLDTLHDGPRMFPSGGMERWTALRLQALGDGMLDAGVLTRYETFLRPEKLRWADWIDNQLLKIGRALDSLEKEAATLAGRIDIGAIAVGCALGYLDFRFESLGWRNGRPALARWYEAMAARPSMIATRPT